MADPKEKEQTKPGLRQAKPKDLPPLTLRPASLPDPHESLIPVISNEIRQVGPLESSLAREPEGELTSELIRALTSSPAREPVRHPEREPTREPARLLAGENAKWLDATHTGSEQRIYSVMYRVTLAKGIRDGYFSVKSLQNATGIGGHDTVRKHLHGLIKKLSVEIINEDYERTIGRLYRVYSPKEIEDRRRQAGIEIDTIKKKIVELSREPTREPVGYLARELEIERQEALLSRPKRGSKALSEQESMYNTKNNTYGPDKLSSVPTQRDDEKLAKVRKLFEQLSNGGHWRDDRDLIAYQEIAHVELHHIIIGLAYSLCRCPEHRYSALSYAIPAILEHYGQMQLFPADDLMKIAYQTMRKALLGLQTGKWTIPEWLAGNE